ncbi:HTH domain-containing protein [Tsukamurella sp. 1534]|uniref:HTH domain-containing protein n=1 Tax=Tsukamurella sp. 1534 TaxID=1151061 RepID=UPI001ED9C303|nr:HTH domain-containing protein [Tsukamurella sp. 1534]
MRPAADLASASRDPYLTLRRVERQQRVVEILAARRGRTTNTTRLAHEVGCSVRSIERDLARLRDCGLPIASRPGPVAASHSSPWPAAPQSRSRFRNSQPSWPALPHWVLPPPTARAAP